MHTGKGNKLDLRQRAATSPFSSNLPAVRFLESKSQNLSKLKQKITLRTICLILKKPVVFSHNKLLHNELDKSYVCANENKHKPRSGPVVDILTIYRFPGTISTKVHFSGCVASYTVRTSWGLNIAAINCTFFLRS